jgi:mono/diheme cytochrome c family protein
MVKFLALIGLLAIVIAVGAAVFFFGGFYTVAANVEDPGIVNTLLIQVRQASIARQAKGITVPSQNDEAVRAGARAYAERGCVNCHGVPPGTEGWAKWSEGMQPGPADFKEVVDARQRNEMFWIIKNGIKMTGMPSFAATGASDDEIWTIVAFVKRFPTVTPEEYKAWTATP